MSERVEDPATSKSFAKAQQPRDSATLILLRHDDEKPRVLLGRRHAAHAFMPDMYVFPGGRRDAADGRTKVEGDLHPEVLTKLMLRMRGAASASRARGLAVAAVRETFEETGFLFSGRKAGSGPTWRELIDRGFAPDLSGLRYFARAITPPGRTRRFDSRFFIADARHIVNLDSPSHAGSGELLQPAWFTFAEADGLDLPAITRDILRRLAAVVVKGGEFAPGGPVCFQYQRGKQWREEML